MREWWWRVERGGVREYEVVMENGSGLPLALVKISFFLLQKESHEVPALEQWKGVEFARSLTRQYVVRAH